jgi:hypothetical protein
VCALRGQTLGPVLKYHQELGTKYLVVPAYFYDSREDALKIRRHYQDKINLINVVNEKSLRVDMHYMMGIMNIQDCISVGNEVCKTDYIILEQDFSSRDELESIRISMNSFKKFTGIQW